MPAKLNMIFTPLIFTVDGPDWANEQSVSFIKALLSKRKSKASNEISINIIRNSFESNIQRMLSNCAFHIFFPGYEPSFYASNYLFKSLCTPSLQNKINFADTNGRIWSDVKQYLTPVSNDVPKVDIQEITDIYESLINSVAWNFYQLVLATRTKCELFLSPDETIQNIERLKNTFKLSSESETRLSIIEGLFRLFTYKMEIPGFYCVSDPQKPFFERIDEILEDASLLEASKLRRFFGIRSNISQLKRDLRKIIKYIAGNKSWAKGLLLPAIQPSFISKDTAHFLEKIIDIVPNLGKDHSSPVLLDPKHNIYRENEVLLEATKNIIKSGIYEWEVRVRIPRHFVESNE